MLMDLNHILMYIIYPILILKKKSANLFTVHALSVHADLASEATQS